MLASLFGICNTGSEIMSNDSFRYLAIQQKIDRNITIILFLKIMTVIISSSLIFALLLNFFFKTEPGSMLLLCLIIFLLNFFMFLISAYLIKKNKEYEEKMYLIEFESLERKKRVAKIREESLSDYVQDYTPKAPDDKLSFPILFYSISFVLSIAVILLLYEAL